jgi:serine/threonine protein kinase
MFEPGDSLDRYIIIKYLGSGAFSEVYLAKNEKWGEEAVKLLPPAEIHALLNGEKDARLVALKIFKPDRREIDYDAIISEAFTAAAFHENPFIVKVFKPGSEGDYYYIPMEYMSGGTLKVERSKPVELETAIAIVLQVCYALRPLHRQGFLHRDVKPGNVLFSNDRKIKLGDFGCAVFSKEKKAKEPVGTPPYMAPEWARFEPHCPESDIYSLGIMFYQLLIGELPYEPPWGLDSLQAMIEDEDLIVKWPDPPPQEILSSIKNIILTATNFNWKERFHTVDEIIGRLEFYLGTETHTFFSDYFEEKIEKQTLLEEASKFNLDNLQEEIRLDRRNILAGLNEKRIEIHREEVLLENFAEAFERSKGELFQGLKDEMKLTLLNSFRASQLFKNGYIGVEHLFFALTLKSDRFLYQSILRSNKSPREIRRKIQEGIDGFRNRAAIEDLVSPRLRELFKRAKGNFPNGVGEREFLHEALDERNFITLLLEEEGMDLAKLSREVEVNEV